MAVYYDKDGNADTSKHVNRVGVFPRKLTKTQLMDTWVASGLAGSRFGEVIKNIDASSNNEVLYVKERYHAAQTFTYDITDSMCGTLVTQSLLTSDEKTTFLNAWPKD